MLLQRYTTRSMQRIWHSIRKDWDVSRTCAGSTTFYDLSALSQGAGL